MTGKLIIFSAPSGTGKSTIINWLMNEHKELNLAFSISCTSRQPRGTEQNGVEYFFLSPEEFRQKIADGEFLEYEEVYTDRFYGTLKSQVERQTADGQNVVFDVDVKGGCNIKRHYGDKALSIFIQPPSVAELRRRLEAVPPMRLRSSTSVSQGQNTSSASRHNLTVWWSTTTLRPPRLTLLPLSRSFAKQTNNENRYSRRVFQPHPQRARRPGTPPS